MFKTLHHAVVIILSGAMVTTGCATSGTMNHVPAAAAADQASATRRALADYLQKLPPGTDVRVGRSNGHSVRGTLIKGTDQSIFIQPRTRVAEPILEIPMTDVLQVTPERHGGHSVGRAIGAGAAAGAAATLAIFLIMFAVYGD
jgi:hypothetical protein